MRQTIKSRLSTLMAMFVLPVLLNAMIASGCAVTAQPVGPGESVGSPDAIGYYEPTDPQKLVGHQAVVGPQEPTALQGTVGLQELDRQTGRIGPADPVVLVARVLRLVGLAETKGRDR
jgi:hypothetical protein